jgi:predicted Rossmann fold nucleotide-binding protein DprA/Smf involved in DNA uptake
MNLTIVGGRDFADVKLLEAVMSELTGSKKHKVDCIVLGGARGADSLGEDWATRNGIETKIFYPNWNKYGRSAGFKRNRLIVEYADAVLAFWDGKSRGTKNTIDIAKSMNKSVAVYTY